MFPLQLISSGTKKKKKEYTIGIIPLSFLQEFYKNLRLAQCTKETARRQTDVRSSNRQKFSRAFRGVWRKESAQKAKRTTRRTMSRNSIGAQLSQTRSCASTRFRNRGRGIDTSGIRLKVKTQKRTRLTFRRSCTCTLFFRKKEKERNDHATRDETARNHPIHKFDSKTSKRTASTEQLVGKKNRARTTTIYPPHCHLCPPVDNIRTMHPYARTFAHTHTYTHTHTHASESPKLAQFPSAKFEARRKRRKKRKGKKGIDA